MLAARVLGYCSDGVRAWQSPCSLARCRPHGVPAVTESNQSWCQCRAPDSVRLIMSRQIYEQPRRIKDRCGQLCQAWPVYRQRAKNWDTAASTTFSPFEDKEKASICFISWQLYLAVVFDFELFHKTFFNMTHEIIVRIQFFLMEQFIEHLDNIFFKKFAFVFYVLYHVW